MGRKDHPAIPLATCGGCGKQTFETRKAAKEWAKKQHPGEHLAAYECPHREGVFHYGHLRAVVAQGRMPRALMVPGVTVSR